jgi:hypothetical protein
MISLFGALLVVSGPLGGARADSVDEPSPTRTGSGEPITTDNWTERAGFAPDLTQGFLGPDEVLDASNWRKAEALIPPGLAELVGNWGLKLRTGSYRTIHPSQAYIDATNANHAGVRAIETGPREYRTKGIEGYVAGLPFPGPKTALEVMWNQHYAYSGDDGSLWFGVFWVSSKHGIQKSEEWRWEYLTRAMHRTDLAPTPEISWFGKRDIQYASLATALSPYDKEGTSALYYRYDKPVDQHGWAYVPGMRRPLKMLFGTPGVVWNNTDMLWEDVRGYSGFPEWAEWRLVGRATILAPMHAGVEYGRKARKRTFDFCNPPHWNPRMTWEPRPVYVVEGTPKKISSLAPHPYSRVVMYVDAETYYVPLKETYDKKGRLWRVMVNAWNESPDMTMLPPRTALSMAVDVRSGRATVFPTYETRTNVGLERARFTETWLRTMGQ